MKKINLKIGTKICQLTVRMFDDEIDIETLLKIDYSNLVAEMLTFPIIVNRFGLLLADMESKVSQTKLDFDIYEAKKRETLRKALTEYEEDKKGGTKVNKPTLDEITSALYKDKMWQFKKQLIFKAQKERDYINSIFWASKDKSAKIDKLSLSIKVGDIEDSLVEKAINGIEIKFAKRLID